MLRDKNGELHPAVVVVGPTVAVILVVAFVVPVFTWAASKWADYWDFHWTPPEQIRAKEK